MTDVTNEAADIITGTYGQGAYALTITYRRLAYTWTVTVYQGSLRIDELCAAYDNNNAAWREAQRIALAAHQGKTVRQIEAEKPSELALAEAKRIIDGVNANLNRMTATQPDTIDVSDIVSGDGYRAERKRAREQAARVNTRSQTHLKPPTPAEVARIRAHHNGVVTCGPGQNWTLLRAIERKGLGVGVPETPGRPKLAYLRLNQRGMAYVEQGSVAA